MASRGENFKVPEDMLLCSVYLESVQDPIIGKNQSKEQLWKRIAEIYNGKKEATWEDRTPRSCQNRITKMEKHVKKLLGCIRQIENSNPSGASNADIILRAKILMQTEKEYKSGFKFDHVMDLMKDFIKFEDNVQTIRKKARAHMDSQISLPPINMDSQQPQHESPHQNSTGLSSFSIDINQSSPDVGVSTRPIGIKKAKKQKANEAELIKALHKKEEQNERFLAMIEKANDIRSRNLDIKEDAILMTDTSKITNPVIRDCMIQRQNEITQRRLGSTTQVPIPSSESSYDFNVNDRGYVKMLQNFDNNDLPPY